MPIRARRSAGSAAISTPRRWMLPALGFGGVSGVSVGKSIRFQVEAVDRPTAATLVDDLCHRFLSNPVIEDSTVTLVERDAATSSGAVSAGVG